MKSREHVEQFKDISQANEEALESLNATFEQYKADTERQIAMLTVSADQLVTLCLG